jgi:hypothetical protein
MNFLFGHLRLFLLISMITGSAFAADIEITETLQLPECHSIGWVRANAGVKGQGAGNLILDEAKWGTPAANQVIEQHWDWNLSDAQWAEAVKQKGEGKKEDVKFDLWMPERHWHRTRHRRHLRPRQRRDALQARRTAQDRP